MTITCLTCAVSRPEAWKLSELYMSRQTMQPIQWLVIDDDTPKTECTMGQEYHYRPEFRGRGSLCKKVRYALEKGLVKGDMLVFWENDDYYAPNYLETAHARMQGVDVAGEGQAIYYNVRERWWFEHQNMQHASLCATYVAARAYPSLLRLVTTSQCPFLDVRIWGLKMRRKVFAANPRTTVGMKAMPGALGYGNGHGERDKSARDDVDLTTLSSWMSPEDAQNYAPFWKNHVPLPELPMPTFPLIGTTPCAKAHGPNWARWLGHLRDTPAKGLEIGTFRGESAEWMLDNIFTHPESEYRCVDPFEGSAEHRLHKIDVSTTEADARARLERFGWRVVIVKKPSGEVLPQIRTRVDFIYVDGDHSAKGALQDGVMGFAILKVGGVIVFDDYEWAAMPNAIDCPKIGINAFLAAYAKQIRVLFKGYQVAVKKISE